MKARDFEIKDFCYGCVEQAMRREADLGERPWKNDAGAK